MGRGGRPRLTAADASLPAPLAVGAGGFPTRGRQPGRDPIDEVQIRAGGSGFRAALPDQLEGGRAVSAGPDEIRGVSAHPIAAFLGVAGAAAG